MKKRKIAFALNLVIVVFTVIALVWMTSGIHAGLLAESKLAALKFFTVDSNILMGIASLIVAIDLWKVIKGKKDVLSIFSYVAALIGTVGVTLTMLVTVFFLAPTMAATYGGAGAVFGKQFLHASGNSDPQSRGVPGL